MDPQIERLAQALVLAITAPQHREADADRLAQIIAHGMAQEAIKAAQKRALWVMDNDLRYRMGE